MPGYRLNLADGELPSADSTLFTLLVRLQGAQSLPGEGFPAAYWTRVDARLLDNPLDYASHLVPGKVPVDRENPSKN